MKIQDLKTIKTEDAAREAAVDWQTWQAEQSLSYGELAEWAAAFEELAAKYPDLRDEFVENGIISESEEYRTPEQFREIVDSMINGNWSQAAQECVDHGFYAKDLLDALEADDNWEECDQSWCALIPDLVLLAELAAEVRYKK